MSSKQFLSVICTRRKILYLRKRFLTSVVVIIISFLSISVLLVFSHEGTSDTTRERLNFIIMSLNVSKEIL